MSDLTAIDILVNPDEAALEHARQLNAQRLLTLELGSRTGRRGARNRR